LFLLSLWILPAHALPEPTVAASQPKTFQTWKDLQVLEAQNQLLRAGARFGQVKAGKPAKADIKDQAPLPSGRVKSISETDPMAVAEKDMRRARESLEAAQGLELSDYVSIYLPSLEAQPDALSGLLQKLTKEELAEILKIVLTKNSRFDSKRNPPVVGGLNLRPSGSN
jgi:hypothetical protein